MKIRFSIIAVVAAVLSLPVIASAAQNTKQTYVAQIRPMNTEVTGRLTAGEAQFVVDGDKLTINIDIHGSAPNTVHWQHFHGFKNGNQATCPSASADSNGDGIVDLIETHPSSGKTMVPFDNNPVAMDVAHGTYPTASNTGTYHYTQTISLKALKDTVANHFDGAKLDLAKRVIFIHGVPADKTLPSSVASLGPIPAQVTLPIACGEIKLAK